MYKGLRYTRRMSRLHVTTLSISFASLLLGACESAPTADAAASPPSEPAAQTESRVYTAGLPSGSSGSGVLDGTRWTITALPGQELTYSDAPSMAFENLGVTGSAGCNRYFGGVSVDEREILISIMRVSRRLCAPEVMATEQAVLEALASADGFAFYGQDRLELSVGDRVIIEAVREP